MNTQETYSNAAPQGAGEWLKAIFMPSSNLSKLGEDKREREAMQAKVLEQGQLDAKAAEEKAKKQKKIIFVGIGAILVVGLGVGMYYAFKK